MYIHVNPPTQEQINEFMSRLNNTSVTGINNKSALNSLNNIAKPFIQTGWQCPRCNKINAPFVTQCNCTNNSFPMQPYCGNLQYNKLDNRTDEILC